MGLRFESHLNFDAYEARILGVLPDAIDDGLTHIKDKAVELVPKESEHLAGTATVYASDGGGSIRFDGPYARYIHEGLEFHHPHGGQAKFLEEPLTTEGPTALRIIAARVRES